MTAGSTPRSTRRPPPPAACRPPTPTSRTSLSAPSWDGRSGPASWPSPATCWSRPTTRRWSCACSRRSPARRLCHYALADAGVAVRRGLQIHDELLFEGPEAEAERAGDIVRAQMGAAYDLDPPLAVDLGIGPNWMEAK